MTILRDQNTSRGDFIFYADRLSTLVVEKALSFIPYQAKTVRTPVGIDYTGMETIEKVRVLVAINRHVLSPCDLTRALPSHTGCRPGF
jgi:uridine kinase